MPDAALATVWLSKSRPVQQLARFLYDLAKNYAAVSAGSSPRGTGKIARILEAYYRTRRPVISKLVKEVEADSISPRAIAIMEPIEGPGTAKAIMEKRLGPIGTIVISNRYQRYMSPAEFMKVLGHEGMHAAQLWRRSRGVDPDKVSDMPWYWEENRLRGYDNNPFEVQARAAEVRSIKDFNNFLKSTLEAVDKGTLQGTPRDIAIDLLRAVNWRTASPEYDVPNWIIPTLESMK